jgi:hypothetical protein
MSPNATGFKTERLNQLNRRGPSTAHAGERVLPREFVEAPSECPWTV